jgi:hypothetical protein
LLTVELKDGRRVVGVARSFTYEFADNRELALRSPLAVQLRADTPLIDSDDAFIVLRENEISSIAGRYVEKSPTSDTPTAALTPSEANGQTRADEDHSPT